MLGDPGRDLGLGECEGGMEGSPWGGSTPGTPTGGMGIPGRAPGTLGGTTMGSPVGRVPPGRFGGRFGGSTCIDGGPLRCMCLLGGLSGRSCFTCSVLIWLSGTKSEEPFACDAGTGRGRLWGMGMAERE